MFLEHGSFESLEIRIKKKHIESQSRAKSGGWYTKGQLEGQHQWTKKMVERAFQWAEQNKKTRVNAVHGEPEAFLLISDTVAFTSTDIEENEQSGAIECEDPQGTLLDTNMTNINAGDDALLSSAPGASSSSGNGVPGPSNVGTMATAGVMMTFPTLVANTSPLMILPQFVEVLGKKIDKINTELDRMGLYTK
ncbi:unnamed protein product [Cladocopium goreaui]|uniref:Uncharacterized protein n=1 Tax=Cladocopium goreaui TaxID=2562237 RepID=A0A9P1D1W3_9DINO|nr:unnamed protein product [Cladocopium goreaui]